VRAVLGGLGLGLGLMKGERLEAFLREPLRVPMQRFPIGFAAVATDLRNGETVLLNHGDAARAVLASSAVPGFTSRSTSRAVGSSTATWSARCRWPPRGASARVR
jgi:predicted acylesterase/phospholipase RssA